MAEEHLRLSGEAPRYRRPRPGRRRPGLGGGLAVVACALAVAIAAAAGPAPSEPRVAAAATAAQGAVSISNSREGLAVLSADELSPGASASGEVTITNSGDAAATFVLALSDLVDAPGPGGGALSGKLDLVIREGTAADAPVVYSGKLAAMPAISLRAPWQPRERRSYSFKLSFPDGGVPSSPTAGDNAYKASSVSVRFDWGANPLDTAPPAPPPEPPAPPPAPSTPPPADTSAPVLTLTSPVAQKLSPSGAVTIDAACQEACRISATGRLSGTPALQKVRLAPVVMSLSGGDKAKLSIRLPKKAVSAVKKAARKKKVTLSVTLVATDVAGNSRTTVVKIGLKR